MYGSGVESVLSAGKPLGRKVGVPSLWPRPAGVVQKHGMGVFYEQVAIVKVCSLFFLH